MTPLRRATVLVMVLALVPSCAPEAATRQGEGIGSLYDFFMIVAAVIFVVVAGLIAWSIVRYRDRGGSEEPPQIHTNVKLEIAWFAIPTVIVAVLFFLSMDRLGTVNEEVDEPAITVSVEAFQWGWRFAYEEDDVTLRSLPQDPVELVLPVDESIAFELESTDVVHSFYIPRLLMKRDVIPGRTNRIDVTFDEPGTYESKCAEFCGVLHDQMDFTIRAVPLDEYQDWTRSFLEDVEEEGLRGDG